MVAHLYQPVQTICLGFHHAGAGPPAPPDCQLQLQILIKFKQFFHLPAQALDYLHRVQRVVHGDLKPENALMGASGRVALSDFGCRRGGGLGRAGGGFAGAGQPVRLCERGLACALHCWGGWACAAVACLAASLRRRSTCAGERGTAPPWLPTHPPTYPPTLYLPFPLQQGHGRGGRGGWRV